MPDDTTTLIRDTYAGCALAKDRLARRVHDRIVRILRAVRAKYPGVRREDQTGDLFNEVWIKAVEDKISRKTFPDYAAFQAYLAATATNLLKDRLKHMRRTAAPHAALARGQGARENEGARFAEEISGHLDLLEALDHALTEEERRLYQLRFVLDMTHDEVAGALCLSEPTTRRRLKEVDAKLRTHLGLPAPTTAQTKTKTEAQTHAPAREARA